MLVEFVNRSSEHPVPLPLRVRCITALSGKALVGFICPESTRVSWQQDRIHLGWLSRASVRSKSVRSLAGAVSRGSRSKGESVPEGNEGVEGRKVGTTPSVPGTAGKK